MIKKLGVLSSLADSWFPNADDSTSTNSANFFWIQPRPFPPSSPCASEISLSGGRGCFCAGETVTLTVSYNTGSNTAYMTIADPSNGDEYAASLPYSSGPLTRRTWAMCGCRPTAAAVSPRRSTRSN